MVGYGLRPEDKVGEATGIYHSDQRRGCLATQHARAAFQLKFSGIGQKKLNSSCDTSIRYGYRAKWEQVTGSFWKQSSLPRKPETKSCNTNSDIDARLAAE